MDDQPAVHVFREMIYNESGSIYLAGKNGATFRELGAVLRPGYHLLEAEITHIADRLRTDPPTTAGHFDYRVKWSDDRHRFVATVDQLPALIAVAKTEIGALRAILDQLRALDSDDRDTDRGDDESTFTSMGGTPAAEESDHRHDYRDR